MSSDEIKAHLSRLHDQIERAHAEVERIQGVMAKERSRYEQDVAVYQRYIDGLAPYAEDDAVKQAEISDYESHITTMGAQFDRSQSTQSMTLQRAQDDLNRLKQESAKFGNELDTVEKQEAAEQIALLAASANGANTGSVS